MKEWKCFTCDITLTAMSAWGIEKKRIKHYTSAKHREANYRRTAPSHIYCMMCGTLVTCGPTDCPHCGAQLPRFHQYEKESKGG